MRSAEVKNKSLLDNPFVKGLLIAGGLLLSAVVWDVCQRMRSCVSDVVSDAGIDLEADLDVLQEIDAGAVLERVEVGRGEIAFAVNVDDEPSGSGPDDDPAFRHISRVLAIRDCFLRSVRDGVDCNSVDSDVAEACDDDRCGRDHRDDERAIVICKRSQEDDECPAAREGSQAYVACKAGQDKKTAECEARVEAEYPQASAEANAELVSDVSSFFGRLKSGESLTLEDFKKMNFILQVFFGQGVDPAKTQEFFDAVRAADGFSPDEFVWLLNDFANSDMIWANEEVYGYSQRSFVETLQNIGFYYDVPSKRWILPPGVLPEDLRVDEGR